ncbi:MAG TPA: bifunctional phosphopantothenoylcysteine decarboxylase/phosphopantothenate--cysteine ligase CoaBC [Vicinamibacterales bacterium]|jgi:phosphopantothenoylcysteine decarboxylase/phosphopantothenate--cysteine ligase|nr:bifunctional phosphopantothenoylcysteine decarboxylase/phosphopantothenate--cysteine ligase CoaBC [Vicinamibacterales bacterium]
MALIALGVCGGIGAYKAVEVARGLQKRGHEVAAMMTRSAQRFVGTVTFEAITRRRVITDQFAEGANSDIEHIALAGNAGLLLVVPATANVIGKFANGIADDFLTSLYLATRAPVLMAPAMNTNMLEHDAVRANMATLRGRGVRFVEPGDGYLACGWIGKGRLAEPEDVVEAADTLLRRGGTLAGRFVVVTAGPTYEDIDDVRYIGNRSSGKMGYALATEAARRGARVLLVSGPTSLASPANVELIRVRSAAQMHAAVMAQSSEADIVIMAAAVADYAPRHRADGKIEKADGPVAVDLVRTRDILADLGAARMAGANPLLIGFAAESGDPVTRAREKLARKNVDMIVANDISRTDAGFESDSNAVTLVTETANEAVPLASKAQVAGIILDRAEALLSRSAAH